MDALLAPNVQNDDFVELSEKVGRKVKGRLFRKQILPEGSFIHPANPSKRIVVDRSFAEKLVENFNAGACSPVQVPIVDDQNRHSEDPTRNIGEVVGLSYEPGVGVFAEIDARKHAEDLGTTMIGASAMISLAYRNNITGAVNSPVLVHVAPTNRPFLQNLSGFEEVLSMSDTGFDGNIINLSDYDFEGGNAMSKDELIAALKDYGVDVYDLERRAAAVEDIAALSNIIDMDMDDSTITLSDLAQETVALDEKNTALVNEKNELITQVEEIRGERDALRLSAAEAEVDALIAEGRLFPKSRDKMIQLSVNDRETFEALVPDEAIVSLSEGQTTTTFESNEGEEEKAQAEIDRYASMLAK